MVARVYAVLVSRVVPVVAVQVVLIQRAAQEHLVKDQRVARDDLLPLAQVAAAAVRARSGRMQRLVLVVVVARVRQVLLQVAQSLEPVAAVAVVKVVQPVPVGQVVVVRGLTTTRQAWLVERILVAVAVVAVLLATPAALVALVVPAS